MSTENNQDRGASIEQQPLDESPFTQVDGLPLPKVTDIATTDPEVVNDTASITTFGDGDDDDGDDDYAADTTEPSVAEKHDNASAPKPNVNVSPTTNLTRPILTPRKKSQQGMWAIIGPGKRTSTLNDNPDYWPSEQELTKNEGIRNYVSAWSMAQYFQVPAINHVDYDKGMYDEILKDTTGDWVQGFKSGDGRDVYLTYTRVKPSQSERIVSGDAVKDLVSSKVGMGNGLRIPLPHTGPHIVLSPRTTEDYLALDVQLNIDKRELGRHTLGLLYQNTNIFLVERAMEFVAGSVRKYNRVNSTDINIFDDIRVTDIPVLIWGMMCTMYQDGYPYDIPCSTGPNVCKHVEHLNLELSDMLLINRAKLSPSQRAKMENIGHKFTDEDIKLYQENSTSPFSKTVTIGEFAFTFEVPSITDYLAAGRSWIEGLSETAKEMFAAVENSEAAQQEYVNRKINIASLREYSAWVKRIVVSKTDVIEGAEDIATALEGISKRKDLVEQTLNAIQSFIENSTVAIIAIPNAACPACEKDFVTDEFSKHPELIPIDPLKLFFALKDRRISLQAAYTTQ